MVLDMILNKDTFLREFEVMVLGNICAHNYNRECFGMSDIKYAMAIEEEVDKIIKKLKAEGYNPKAIVGEILKKYGYTLKKEYEGKTVLDEAFRMDMSEHKWAYEYSKAVYEDTLDSWEKGLLDRI